ncbi:MAG: peptide ABC transporter substrate-binding protein [Clostridia bacterium]|nr:peptide ABC transporter substrate-binding protein [Clostridia bacterium]
MKRIIAAVAAIILLLTCSACTPKGSGKSIAYPISSSPKTLDPQFADDANAMLIINNTFEGLVRLDANGDIIPGIAESWTVSSDGKTYTFKLKKGTEWYCPNVLKSEFGKDFYDRFSSEKVTAHDFVFAFQRAVMPETGSPNAHRLFVIENAYEVHYNNYSENLLGVSAPDNHTLIIKLTEECDDFLQRLTESVFMPCNKDFFNAMNGKYGLSHKHILCNGPFYVSSWDTETSLTVKRNEYYAGEQEVMPASVVFSYDSSKESVAKKVSEGSATAAFLPPDCPIPENSKTVSSSENSVFGFVFNCADPDLAEASLRIAMCKSIDRSLFEEKENAVPQSGFVPANCLVGTSAYREQVGSQTLRIEQDNAQAATLWKEGLANLGKDSVQLTVLCPEWLDGAVRQQLQIWQKTLGVSIGISIENKSPEEISKAVAKGEYQIALTSIESAYENTTDFLAVFSDGGVFNHNSASYDGIVNDLIAAESYDDIIKGCYNAENYILQNALCYPLYSRSSRFVVHNDADGIVFLGSETNVSFIGAKRYD